FMPSLVRIFHKERSQYIPLDPNLVFWCVSFRLGAFGTVSLIHETWCKMRPNGAINVKVRATKSCHNFSQRMLTIHTIGPKTHVLVHFFPFGCIWDRFAI